MEHIKTLSHTSPVALHPLGCASSRIEAKLKQLIAPREANGEAHESSGWRDTSSSRRRQQRSVVLLRRTSTMDVQCKQPARQSSVERSKRGYCQAAKSFRRIPTVHTIRGVCGRVRYMFEEWNSECVQINSLSESNRINVCQCVCRCGAVCTDKFCSSNISRRMCVVCALHLAMVPHIDSVCDVDGRLTTEAGLRWRKRRRDMKK